MKTVIRRTFKELHEHFQTYDPQYCIYRGVSSVEHGLITTLGRLKLKKDDDFDLVEKRALRIFKERKRGQIYFISQRVVEMEKICPLFAIAIGHTRTSNAPLRSELVSGEPWR
jgi:hypothetical protein